MGDASGFGGNLAWLLGLAVVLSSCFGSSAPPRSTFQSGPIYAEEALRPVDDGSIVAVTGSVLPEAGSDPFTTELSPGSGARGPGSKGLAKALVQSFAKRTGKTLAGDRRLAELAARLASRVGASGEIDGRLVAYEGQRLGLPFATPQSITLRFSAGVAQAELEAELGRGLSTLPLNMPFERFGVAVLARGAIRTAVAIIGAAELTLAPVPRHAHRGEAIVLKGSVAERFKTARISVTRPDGSVRNFSAPERTFEVKVALPIDGVWGLELLGDGSMGPVVVANFPVYVDHDEPPAPEPAARVDSAALTQDAVEDRLFELINQERARVGVPKVARLEALVPVARAHGQDMADHGFFGHVSPTTGGPAERVKQAGLSLAIVGENLGRGPSADDVHRMLMESPAHRGAMLEPRFTHVGVGAIVTEEKGARSVIATELFTAIQGAFDARAAAVALLGAINQRRHERGARALLADSELSGIAELAANRFARNRSLTLEDALRVAANELERLAPELTGRGLSRTEAHAAAVALVSEAAELAAPQDFRASSVGIGIGERPASGGNPPIVVVVVLLGYGSAS